MHILVNKFFLYVIFCSVYYLIKNADNFFNFFLLSSQDGTSLQFMSNISYWAFRLMSWAVGLLFKGDVFNYHAFVEADQMYVVLY